MNDVLINQDDCVLVVTLNRPTRLNAFSDTMLESATEAIVDAMGSRTVRAILLTGSGRGFCVGADLLELRERRDGVEQYLMGKINRLVLAIHEVRVPVVIGLNGVAAGAGLGVALAGDIIVAARSARLLTAFSGIGVGMDAGVSWSLTRKLGPSRASALAMIDGAEIDAATAKDWGLLWEVVDDDQLMSKALDLAHSLAAGPTVALGIIKRQIALASSVSYAEALRQEAAWQDRAFKSDDFLEGLDAFQEKRPPRFRGR